MKPSIEMNNWNGAAQRQAVPRDLAALMPFANRASAVAFASAGQPPLRAAPDPADPADGGRRKIWQLGTSLHCSIIGTCLTTGELRTVLRKFGALVAENPSDHDIHGLAVSAVGSRSPLAKQIEKALDRRHGPALHRFAKAEDEAALQRLWDEAKQSSDIPGGYWAVMTHPAATDALIRRAFGDVHMLSHLVGAANRADIRRLHQLEREKEALEDKLARQQAHLRDSIVARDTKIRDLNTMLAARIERGTALPASGAAGETEMLRSLVVDLRKRLETEARRRQHAERRADTLSRDRADAERERAAFEREAAELRRELDAAEAAIASFAHDQSDGAQVLDLGGLTLLYVGGRPPLAARLKVLTERAQGQFIHHDGGIEDRRDLLPGLVSRADAAFFPADCVSHDAAQSLKRLCAQLGKSFVPLRSSSVASFLRAVGALAGDRASRAASPPSNAPIASRYSGGRHGG